MLRPVVRRLFPRPSSIRRPLLPVRLRFALCVMLAVYPLLTLLSLTVTPLTLDWPLPARNAVLVPMMVLSIIYGVIPAVHRLAGGWIQAGAPAVDG
jgi:antibiotic biosynthesis monooxygenase (ABM) superfamily enzyme